MVKVIVLAFDQNFDNLPGLFLPGIVYLAPLALARMLINYSCTSGWLVCL